MSTHAPEHPRDRAIEPEDPMLLTGEPVRGEPLFMLDSLIEEFAGQGWDKARILRLFDAPFFQATWGLRQALGRPRIEAHIDAVLARFGVQRTRTRFPPAKEGESDAQGP